MKAVGTTGLGLNDVKAPGMKGLRRSELSKRQSPFLLPSAHMAHSGTEEGAGFTLLQLQQGFGVLEENPSTQFHRWNQPPDGSQGLHPLAGGTATKGIVAIRPEH